MALFLGPPYHHNDKAPYLVVLRKPDLARRMIAWSIELSKFSIKYRPWGPIKAHALVDFIVEL